MKHWKGETGDSAGCLLLVLLVLLSLLFVIETKISWVGGGVVVGACFSDEEDEEDEEEDISEGMLEFDWEEGKWFEWESSCFVSGGFSAPLGEGVPLSDWIIEGSSFGALLREGEDINGEWAYCVRWEDEKQWKRRRFSTENKKPWRASGRLVITISSPFWD